jgi:hypothetical protein
MSVLHSIFLKQAWLAKGFTDRGVVLDPCVSPRVVSHAPLIILVSTGHEQGTRYANLQSVV